MNNKRQLKKIESAPFPLWKVKPPGPEQKELDRMFASNEIDFSYSPDHVRKSNPIFQKFSANVFGAHFRRTKAKFGLFASDVDCDTAACNIKELGSPKVTESSVAPAPSQPNIERENIQFINPPFWTWVYTDHEKKMDFVCIAVVIISGSRNINFTISEDGMQVTIKYTWPTAIYNAVQLFEKAKVGDKKISIQHPKVHSFVSNALQSGVTDNSNPQAEIIVDLPQKVQRNTTSLKKEAININDTKIILLELSAYQKSLIFDNADTSINF